MSFLDKFQLNIYIFLFLILMKAWCVFTLLNQILLCVNRVTSIICIFYYNLLLYLFYLCTLHIWLHNYCIYIDLFSWLACDCPVICFGHVLHSVLVPRLWIFWNADVCMYVRTYVRAGPTLMNILKRRCMYVCMYEHFIFSHQKITIFCTWINSYNFNSFK
jgi:hypothetical protein